MSFAFMVTAARLRREAGVASCSPVNLEAVLPRLYTVDCVRLPGLTVTRLREWLQQWGIPPPPCLTTCRDRRLRGGAIGWGGFGLLFVDQQDPEDEQQYTLAHEAGHFLGDHLYPRRDVLERLGPSIQPVLDGLRAPTSQERIHAILANASLIQCAHLLGREANDDAETAGREAEADRFAREILAPRAALAQRFAGIRADHKAVAKVQTVLIAEYHLPSLHASHYARAFVAEQRKPNPLLQRLRLSDE
jgi:hypothetical protein